VKVGSLVKYKSEVSTLPRLVLGVITQTDPARNCAHVVWSYTRGWWDIECLEIMNESR